MEEEANRILKESLKGTTSHAAKADILTQWKEQDRRSREVYVRDGTPDPSVRLGMYHRVINPARPDLNSRMGIAQARSGIAGSLATFMDEHGHDD